MFSNNDNNNNRYLIAIILIIFCFFNFHYIYQRIQEKKRLDEQKIRKKNNNNNNNNLNSSSDDKKKFFLRYDTSEWIKNNQTLIHTDNDDDGDDTIKNNNNKSLCKGIVIEIDKEKANNTCNELSQNLCDGKVLLKKVTIPVDSIIDFYSHSGYKLTKGQSYCIYKPPPVASKGCNETWGFWKYSLKYEMWRCKSKVPGVYNEELNTFDPCSQGQGHLFYSNHYLPNDHIEKSFYPERFYSLDFQRKFRCECPRGYISRPELSRTTCFKDPCLINLPPNAYAGGYDEKTGNCNCGPFFKNLYPDNLKSPCTMCPDAPIWDHINNNLTIYVKCGGENDRFKCKTEEDKLRGCLKTILKVKPINVDRLKSTTFKNLTFF